MSEVNNQPSVNVFNLANKLEAMSQPHAKTGKNNLWDVAVSINRTNGVPLDKSSVVIKRAATDTEDAIDINSAKSAATAYPGQIISELDTATNDGKVYVLQPTGHSHKTHISELIDTETVYPTDITKTVGTAANVTHEELAYQSTVDRLVNEEVYRRKVSDKARRDSDLAIIEFLGGNGKLPSETDVIANLELPEKLSDGTKHDQSTVLAFLAKTVEAERTRRINSDQDLAEYIGSTNWGVDDVGEINSNKLTLPEKLSDKNARSEDTKTVLDFIQATVEAEVQKRYQQDQVLLQCINKLSLTEVIPETVAQTTTTIDAQDEVNSALTYTDGTLLVYRALPFRTNDSLLDVQDKSTINTNSEEFPYPLKKYNGGYPTT